MITGTRHTETHWVFDTDEGKKVFGRDALTEEQALELLTNPPLEGFKDERISQIKAVAQERIYAIVPAWKQSNFNARTNELNMIRFEREWNHEELAEIAFMSMVWESVKEIRANSTAAEAAVNAATTIQEINAVEF